MPGQFRKYFNQNQIGVLLLTADDPLSLHMMHGMTLSAKNVEVHYNVIEVLDLVCR